MLLNSISCINTYKTYLAASPRVIGDNLPIPMESQSSTWELTSPGYKVKSLSHVQLFATPRTVVYQAPPSMGLSRQEYQSGLPFPSPCYSKALSQGLRVVLVWIPSILQDQSFKGCDLKQHPCWLLHPCHMQRSSGKKWLLCLRIWENIGRENFNQRKSGLRWNWGES